MSENASVFSVAHLDIFFLIVIQCIGLFCHGWKKPEVVLDCIGGANHFVKPLQPNYLYL